VPSPSPKVHEQQKRASAEGEAMHDVEAAFAAYNELASKYGLTVCSKLTGDLRAHLGKVLHDIIDGLAGFRLALTVIPSDDYLTGRKTGKPFTLQRLMPQKGLLGELRDKAAGGNANPTESVDAEVERLAAGKNGLALIDEVGREKALQAIRELVLGQRGGVANG
jgi:hypothetical protein